MLNSVRLHNARLYTKIDSTVGGILNSTGTNEQKLASLKPYLQVGDDFTVFRHRMRQYPEEDIQFEYGVRVYYFRKCGLKVVTWENEKVYAIGQRKDIAKSSQISTMKTGGMVENLATQWLVRPGDLMYPDDGSKPTTGPYTVDHRIKEILDDSFGSLYANRRKMVLQSINDVAPETYSAPDRQYTDYTRKQGQRRQCYWRNRRVEQLSSTVQEVTTSIDRLVDGLPRQTFLCAIERLTCEFEKERPAFWSWGRRAGTVEDNRSTLPLRGVCTKKARLHFCNRALLLL